MARGAPLLLQHRSKRAKHAQLDASCSVLDAVVTHKWCIQLLNEYACFYILEKRLNDLSALCCGMHVLMVSRHTQAAGGSITNIRSEISL